MRQPIDNSIDGLRNYLSAVNIRNKCKHPLFLALRFDACIGLLYDSSRAANPAHTRRLLEKAVEPSLSDPPPNPPLLGGPRRRRAV